VIKTVLALSQGPAGCGDDCRIVAEISDPRNVEAARLAGGPGTVLIDKSEAIAPLIVQASRQAGISVVYNELLDFAGDEIYFRRDPELVGRSFSDALLAYEDCAVIGLRGPELGSRLNPHPETRIGAEHELIAIASDDAALASATSFQGEVHGAAVATRPSGEPNTQRVLVLGWNRRGPDVLVELDQYVSPGSTVTVMADWEAARAMVADVAERLENLGVDFRLADTSDRRALDAVDIHGHDQVIVLCYSEVLDTQRADARTLVTLLQLRDIASSNGSGFSVVSEMLDDRNRELAQVARVDDVIVSDEVTSLMVAQLSENPHLEEVFAELFAAEGSELYLRPAGEYVTAGEINFATLVEAARRRGEVAVGYRLASEADDPARQFGVRVNPPKSEPVEIGADDRVIVLARE